MGIRKAADWAIVSRRTVGDGQETNLYCSVMKCPRIVEGYLVEWAFGCGRRDRGDLDLSAAFRVLDTQSMDSRTYARHLKKAVAHLREADAGLRDVIARVGPPQLAITEDFIPFQSLVSSICHQQLHGKAARTILERVKNQLGDGNQVDMKRVIRARLSTMRGCGLSEAKSLAVKDLAKKCLDGTVPEAKVLHHMDDEDIVERLTEVRGVGRWTVQMILIFHLGRLDVFPVDDFGVRNGFAKLRRLPSMPTAKMLMPEGDIFRPYRSVASWYLWRVAGGQ